MHRQVASLTSLGAQLSEHGLFQDSAAALLAAALLLHSRMEDAGGSELVGKPLGIGAAHLYMIVTRC